MPTTFEQELTREQAAVVTAEQIKDNIKTVAENKGLIVEETDTPLSVLTKIDNNTIATPTETISITQNGTVDVTNYASANVNVSSGDNKFSQLVDRSITTVTAQDLGDITSIESYAFYDCSSLTTITLPEGVTSIEQYAFQSCRSLTTITIPKGVKSIKSYAFQNCRKFQSIDFGTNSSLQTIGDYAFDNCVSLTTITIPQTVTSIGNGVFDGCSSLQIVIYKGQVPNIRYNCFYNCSSITKYDFRNCTTVPTLANVNTLGHATGCEIIIPDALYDDWTTATNWVSLTGVTFIKASEYIE